MSCSMFLTINVSVIVCSENQNTQFISNIFLKSCLYENIYENIALPDKPEITVLSLAR